MDVFINSENLIQMVTFALFLKLSDSVLKV